MCQQFQQSFDGDHTAPRRSRAAVRAELTAVLSDTAQTPFLDDALLVISELVTNAVRAGSDPLTVATNLHKAELEIAVLDHGAGWPVLQPPEHGSDHGRGLAIIEAVARSWGTERRAAGKAVWAVLALPADLTGSVPCTPAARSATPAP